MMESELEILNMDETEKLCGLIAHRVTYCCDLTEICWRVTVLSEQTLFFAVESFFAIFKCVLFVDFKRAREKVRPNS